MSSYSSLLSVSPGEQIGGYADEGDHDDMAAATNYPSSFCFDFGEEYYSLAVAATASYPLHAQQQQPPTQADSHHSGKAASTTSSSRGLDNINT